MWYSPNPSHYLAFQVGQNLQCRVFALQSKNDSQKVCDLIEHHEIEKTNLENKLQEKKKKIENLKEEQKAENKKHSDEVVGILLEIFILKKDLAGDKPQQDKYLKQLEDQQATIELLEKEKDAEAMNHKQQVKDMSIRIEEV